MSNRVALLSVLAINGNMATFLSHDEAVRVMGTIVVCTTYVLLWLSRNERAS